MEQNFIDDCIAIYNKYCYPVLFENISRPPIWPVIVMAIIIFIAVAEIGSQSCQDGHCNHYDSIYKVSDKDPSTEHIDSLVSRVKLNHTVVGWRRALLLAIILSLIILVLFYPGLPDGFDFFLVSTILFLVIYFTSTWFQWHWWKAKDFNIEDSLYHLRHQIKQKELDHCQRSNRMNHGDPIINKISSILG